jgi:hypothetical protein
MTDTAVFGIYSTHDALEAAVDALRAKGFKNTDISVLTAPNPAFKAVTADVATPPDPPAGPGAAASLGGALGWLVGASALAIAGGVFIVAGPIMAALGTMGETVGNIANALTGLGVSEVDAKQFEGRIASGAMLLSVHTDDKTWFAEGKEILEQTGAEEITATGTQPS